MVLVCHKVSQDHVKTGSSNIMFRCPSRLVTILSRLVTTGTVVVEI